MIFMFVKDPVVEMQVFDRVLRSIGDGYLVSPFARVGVARDFLFHSIDAEPVVHMLWRFGHPLRNVFLIGGAEDFRVDLKLFSVRTLQCGFAILVRHQFSFQSAAA